MKYKHPFNSKGWNVTKSYPENIILKQGRGRERDLQIQSEAEDDVKGWEVHRPSSSLPVGLFVYSHSISGLCPVFPIHRYFLQWT